MDSIEIAIFLQGYNDARNGVPLSQWRDGAYVDGWMAYARRTFVRGWRSLSEGA